MFTRRNKFGARRTNGFASALENAVHEKLLEREKLGLIKNIKQQSTVTLINCDECGTTIKWKVDFSFEELRAVEEIVAETFIVEKQWLLTFAEAKGVETSDYLKKLKLWRKIKPAKLEIWKGNWRYPKLVEVIQ